MNQAPQVEYDDRKQMEYVQQLMSGGETLYAVLDERGRANGFVGITDRRLIFTDSLIRKARIMISLPYSRITAVGAEDSGTTLFATSKLLIIAGNREFDFTFRTKEKAHRAHELIMWNLFQNERAGVVR